MIFAIEIQGFNLTTEAVETLYFSTAPLVTGAADTPAHTAFDAGVGRMSWMGANLFRDGATYGASQVTPAEIEVKNADGRLDGLLGYAFGGRPIVVRSGEAGAAYPGAWTAVIVGTVEQPTYTEHALTFRVRDRTELFRRPAQPNVYAGNNSLPNGLEGTTDDLKGQRKPLVFGYVLNAPMPCCNTSRLIYQAHDGAVVDVPAVYDAGVALTKGTDYTNQADMEATAPAAGHYRVWPAGGYVRLGSTPAGQITADIEQATGTDADLAAVFAAVVAAAEADTGETITVNSTDLAAINAVRPYRCGVWATGMTYLQALDLLAGAGIWYHFDALGELRLGRLIYAYSGPSRRVLTGGDIIKIEVVSTRDESGGVPVRRVLVDYARNWTVQRDVAGSVSAARRAWLAQEWRTYKRDNPPGLSDRYILSPEMRIQTALVDAADVSYVAAAVANMYGLPWKLLRVTANLPPAEMDDLRVGVSVPIYYPRWGLDRYPAAIGGTYFHIVGLNVDMRTGNIEMLLWGGFGWVS
jgi:hypothetical protein